jgi:hypothetical protein
VHLIQIYKFVLSYEIRVYNLKLTTDGLSLPCYALSVTPILCQIMQVSPTCGYIITLHTFDQQPYHPLIDEFQISVLDRNHRRRDLFPPIYWLVHWFDMRYVTSTRIQCTGQPHLRSRHSRCSHLLQDHNGILPQKVNLEQTLELTGVAVWSHELGCSWPPHVVLQQARRH